MGAVTLRAAVWGAAVTVGLVACGGSGEEGADTAVAPTTASPPVSAGSPSPSATTAAAPRSCTATPVAASGSFHLKGVQVATDATTVTVTYQWSGMVPQTGAVLWSVTASAADGSRPRRLGFKIIEGQSSLFVSGFSAGQYDDFLSIAEMEPHRLVTEFSATAVTDLGAGWRWRATLTVAGTVIDQCTPD
ncbi:hypothetical protein ACFFMN_17590 [Planobispora siamensis]|uniref:Lipoprotein n=1 Tax=Planobispora siamensis TaxID=936338 RepID=A0A8J3WS30_9ACTN|nr:hypothetical protein [Planobispora siamensis]GIH97486.1 hypothetical protein Psi01_81160 [Planobispora siamensis]